MPIFQGNNVRLILDGKFVIDPDKTRLIDDATFVPLDVPSEPLKIEPFTVTNTNVRLPSLAFYEMERAISMVSFAHFPYRLAFRLLEDDPRTLDPTQSVAVVEIQADVLDAYVGQPTSVSIKSVYDPKAWKTPFHFLRASIARLIVHELDEMMLVDGKRIFDPHQRRDG